MEGENDIMEGERGSVKRGSIEGDRGREETKGNPLGVPVPTKSTDKGAGKGEGGSSVVPVEGGAGDGDNNEQANKVIVKTKRF